MQRGKEAEETQESVDERNDVQPLPVDVLQSAVVDAVQGQVHEEDGQQVVGSARSPREAEIQAEDEVYNRDNNEADQSGFSFRLGSFRTVSPDQQALYFFRDDLGDNE